MLPIKAILTTFKSEGLSKTFKKYGWRTAALVVTYYIIRDVTLYVIIPAVVASRS